MNISVTELMEYTDWERAKWRERLGQDGDAALQMSAGPHGDGRFGTIGELIRHVFSAELRYCQRLSGEALTDTSGIPCDRVEEVFAFGEQSRARLRELVATLPEERWDVPLEFVILHFRVTATARKVIAHVLLHEIRHWAQIATLFRLEGVRGEFQDFLASPVMGGGFAQLRK